MILSGKNVRKVTIEKESVETDDYGQEIKEWAPDSTIAANGKVYMEWWDQGGREALSSGQIIAVEDVRAKCRYIKGLSQHNQHKYRIIKDGVKYDIQNVKEIGRREGQILMLKARDNE